MDYQHFVTALLPNVKDKQQSEAPTIVSDLLTIYKAITSYKPTL